MSRAAVLVALGLDTVLREPPLAMHPVRGIGALLERLGRRVPASPPTRALLAGGAAWVVGLTVTVSVARSLDAQLSRLPPGVASLARGLALWPLLSLAMLVDEVETVERALRDGGPSSPDSEQTPVGTDPLDAARTQVARIVSRDVSEADAPQLRTAAICSLAENASDGLVGPLCCYALWGLPGAAAYRYVNTADAMWGYRNDRWKHAGRVAARADDVANLLPARLTGVVLGWGGPDLRTLRREARRTPSPNGGWPMGAVARQLDIRCDKPGSYTLHPEGRPPRAGDIGRALRLVGPRTLAIGIGLAALSGRSRRCRR